MKDFQTKIDSYLERICRPLARTLSADEVTDQRAEMRTHLEALVAAQLEAGRSEAEAIKLTLEQFGKERRIQHDWQNECEITRIESEQAAFRPAFQFAVRSFGFAFLLLALNGECMILLFMKLSASEAFLYWIAISLMALWKRRRTLRLANNR
jgi:hypothetical protein